WKERRHTFRFSKGTERLTGGIPLSYDIVTGTALPPPKLRRAAFLRYAHRAPSRGSHVLPEISNAHCYRSAHLSARSECTAKSGGRKRLAPPSLCRCSVSKDHVVS